MSFVREGERDMERERGGKEREREERERERNERGCHFEVLFFRRGKGFFIVFLGVNLEFLNKEISRGIGG
jgi:hypothetical protein